MSKRKSPNSDHEREDNTKVRRIRPPLPESSSHTYQFDVDVDDNQDVGDDVDDDDVDTTAGNQTVNNSSASSVIQSEAMSEAISNLMKTDHIIADPSWENEKHLRMLHMMKIIDSILIILPTVVNVIICGIITNR